MTPHDVYELNVYADSNRSFRIVGYFTALDAAYTSWRDSTFDDNSKIEVVGFSDDARQVPTRLSLSRSIIEGMRLEVL